MLNIISGYTVFSVVAVIDINFFQIHLFHQITDSWSFVFAGNFRIRINELFLIFKQQFKHNIVMTTNHWILTSS